MRITTAPAATGNTCLCQNSRHSYIRGDNSQNCGFAKPHCIW